MHLPVKRYSKHGTNWKGKKMLIKQFDYTHNEALRTTGTVIITDYSIIVSVLGGEREDSFTWTTRQDGMAGYVCMTANVDGSVRVGKYTDRVIKEMEAARHSFIYNLPIEAQEIIKKELEL